MITYEAFLDRKSQLGGNAGFDPLWMPDFLHPFQQHLTQWALRKGRSAIFADCGLGKTPMQLVWADNIVRKTGKRVLILTPLAVAQQTCAEASKFDIESSRSHAGKLHAGINVTNYDRLHFFNPDDFAGVVCDESSILKHFSGATQKQVTRFMSKHAFRLLCTATAAPNDYTELGTSSEALGELGHSDMLTRFFKMDDKKRAGNHFAKLAYRVAQQMAGWRLKGHAEQAFWRWVCSWAIACRMPSDLGFEDADFILPELTENHHVIEPSKPADGMLFTVPAFGLGEEREERGRTLQERCEYVARLADHKEQVVIWCHYNKEGELLSKLIPGAVEVSGATPDEEKEESYISFAAGEIRALVIKPKIGAWGMNWQNCAHTITFASHSYEQYYQSIRRFWRFGQTRPVRVDIVATKGEQYVSENMQRKGEAAKTMFENLVAQMNNSLTIPKSTYTHQPTSPSWL